MSTQWELQKMMGKYLLQLAAQMAIIRAEWIKNDPKKENEQ